MAVSTSRFQIADTRDRPVCLGGLSKRLLTLLVLRRLHLLSSLNIDDAHADLAAGLQVPELAFLSHSLLQELLRHL